MRILFIKLSKKENYYNNNKNNNMKWKQFSCLIGQPTTIIKKLNIIKK